MDIDQYILIHKTTLENVFLRKKPIEFIGILFSVELALIVSLITTKDYVSVFGLHAEAVGSFVKIVISVLPIIGLVYFLIIATKKDNILTLSALEKEIKKHSLTGPVENTIVFLFCKKDRGIVKFAVAKKEKWNNSYFFPYKKEKGPIEDLSNYIERNKNIIVNDALKNNGFAIDIDTIVLHDLAFSSTKLSAEGIPRQFMFRFVQVFPRSQFLRKYMEEKIFEYGYEFKGIEELLSDRATIKYNSDVADRLQEYMKLIQNNLDEFSKIPSKIVWNIDKNCTSNCKICAYGDGEHNVVTLPEKKQIVDSLRSVDVTSIDVATGNSPNINDLREIMAYIRNQLPGIDLSITTTANVINDLSVAFIKQKKINVDITYDVMDGDQEKKNKFRPDGYGDENYNVAKVLVKSKVKVKVHVVIFEDTSDADILTIRNKLHQLKIHDILLIRLMPVGKQAFKDYPQNLLDKSVYEKIIKAIRNNKDGIRFHCALQGIVGTNCIAKYQCELGINKLGISSTGDIFACPWAEHLCLSENPFKLGNILNEGTDMATLLINSENYLKLISRNSENQPHCKIFASYSGDMFSKTDALYS